MKAPVIYKIRNVVNGKFYVGSTMDTRERFRTHRNKLRATKHHCAHLQAAWDKYGEECFVFEIVEQVSTLDALQAAEDVWLAAHVGAEHCYNVGTRSGAPWRGGAKEAHPCFGVPKSEQTRAAIAASLTAVYAADPTSHPRYGKTHTDETKAKMSASRTGKMTGDRHYRFGQTLSAEVREKIGAAQRGVKKAPRVLTDEGRAKIKAAAAAGHYASFLGRQHTAEAKAKMSQAVQTVSPEGVTTTYPSITALREALGLKAPTVNRALKSGLPLTKGPFRGWTFKKRSTP